MRGLPRASTALRQAPGSERQVQAEELRSWLGALAIDFRRIAVRGDASPDTPLRIEVMP